MLVMGAWFHGGWSRSDGDFLGHVPFGSKTSVFYRENIEFPFFSYWLKDKKNPNLPKAYVFETGANQWRQFDAWPPKSVAKKSLYFHSGGKLSFDPPSAAETARFDEYISDPAKPVPFIVGQAPGMTREHMTEDQRFASTRTDVLVYETEPLTEDLTMAGPIWPSLHVSTTGTDSDFVVKLIDVYPGDYPDPDPDPTGLHIGGYQQLLRGEVMRGRFRNSFERPEPFVPGNMAKIEDVITDFFHTFRQSHHVLVQVQSSWVPLADRNPQTFVEIYNAKTSVFQMSTERIYHTSDAPSSIAVNVLNP